MSLKVELKPSFSIPFENENIVSVSLVRYLDFLFWLKAKLLRSCSACSCKIRWSLKAITFANWGLSKATSRIMYKAVFLVRVDYALELWTEGVLTKKVISLFGSKQRSALISISVTYRIISTDSLQVVSE